MDISHFPGRHSGHSVVCQAGGDVRGELHKRKSPACRLNTNCFRVALARMGHPESRDLTFQYLKLVQIFTPRDCPDTLPSPVTMPSPFHVHLMQQGCCII